MVSLVGIVAGIAAVLAVIVTAVVIAVCLAIGWMTDTARAGRSHSPRGVRGVPHGTRGVHGGGRHADRDASYSGQRAQERFPRAGRLAYGQELASLAHLRLLHQAASPLSGTTQPAGHASGLTRPATLGAPVRGTVAALLPSATHCRNNHRIFIVTHRIIENNSEIERFQRYHAWHDHHYSDSRARTSTAFARQRENSASRRKCYPPTPVVGNISSHGAARGPRSSLTAWPLAMVFAEKIVTAVARGTQSTRWRDFADIYSLARRHTSDGVQLARSVREVAAHRGTELVSLSEVLEDYGRNGQRQWSAWLRRQQMVERLPDQFSDVVAAVIAFADPAITGTSNGCLWLPEANAWLPKRPPSSSVRPVWKQRPAGARAHGPRPVLLRQGRAGVLR